MFTESLNEREGRYRCSEQVEIVEPGMVGDLYQVAKLLGNVSAVAYINTNPKTATENGTYTINNIFVRVPTDRELWVVKLTTATDLLGVPNIKIVGNIHGNEPVGREIVLHLIQVYCGTRLSQNVYSLGYNNTRRAFLVNRLILEF